MAEDATGKRGYFYCSLWERERVGRPKSRKCTMKGTLPVNPETYIVQKPAKALFQPRKLDMTLVEAFVDGVASAFPQRSSLH